MLAECDNPEVTSSRRSSAIHGVLVVAGVVSLVYALTATSVARGSGTATTYAGHSVALAGIVRDGRAGVVRCRAARRWWIGRSSGSCRSSPACCGSPRCGRGGPTDRRWSAPLACWRRASCSPSSSTSSSPREPFAVRGRALLVVATYVLVGVCARWSSCSSAIRTSIRTAGRTAPPTCSTSVRRLSSWRTDHEVAVVDHDRLRSRADGPVRRPAGGCAAR